MKCLSILMAVLTGAVPVVTAAATMGGMPTAISPACGAANGCLAVSATGQQGAVAATALGSTEASQTANAMTGMIVAAAAPGVGQSVAGAGNVGTGAVSMPGGSAAGTGPAGVNSGGNSPGGANSGGSGAGNSVGGGISQPSPPGGDNDNLFNRRIDKEPGGAPSAGPPAVSESDAARRVRQSTGGRILDMKPENSQGRLTYRFKVLNDAGEVRIITIDAQTGARE